MELLADDRDMPGRNQAPFVFHMQHVQRARVYPGPDQITRTEQFHRGPARNRDFARERAFQNQVADEQRAGRGLVSCFPGSGFEAADFGGQGFAGLVEDPSLNPAGKRGLGIEQPDRPF